MVRVGIGDAAAFTELIDRYQTSILRFCSGVLSNRHIAEEAAQDTFLSLWQHRSRYHSNERFRTFLFTVALNRCRSLLRRRKILSFIGVSTFDNETGSLVDGERAVHTTQISALLHKALRQLPDKYRVPLVLRFVEEMEYDVIAQIIGRTPSTARSRVHFGLKALAKTLPQEMTPWNA